MKCYLEKCINNDEWACMYRDDCDYCNKDCKNYYKCSSCDYYMDEDIEKEFQQGGEIEDALWFHDDGCTEVIIPESHSDFRLLCQCANCKHEWILRFGRLKIRSCMTLF